MSSRDSRGSPSCTSVAITIIPAQVPNMGMPPLARSRSGSTRPCARASFAIVVLSPPGMARQSTDASSSGVRTSTGVTPMSVRTAACSRKSPWRARTPAFMCCMIPAHRGSPPSRYPAGMRIFSGIQPTGRKHLGNYIGAIRQYVEGQDRGDAIYCIVDLHAITVAYDPVELRERLYDTTAILLAAGLDPDRCILFRQSDVREHAELCWLLSSVTAYGELGRMTQFKEKAPQQKELVSAGLFFYPVLQAADVLAYKVDEVPVGEDQKQHIELMREVAQRFNARFGETLVVPEHRIPKIGARIMDLQ